MSTEPRCPGQGPTQTLGGAREGQEGAPPRASSREGLRWPWPWVVETLANQAPWNTSTPLAAKRWLEITESRETLRRLIYSNTTLSSTWSVLAGSGAWPGVHMGAGPAAGGGAQGQPRQTSQNAPKSACSPPGFSLKGGKEPHEPSTRVST